MRNRSRLLVLPLALVTTLAVAQVLSIFSVQIDSAYLDVSTATLPKGWFSNSNAFDRTKTELQTSYSFDATACSSAATGGTVSSLNIGNFVHITNPAGNVTAYTWDTSVDLSSFQNHWYEHVHCDGTVEVHGCADARPVRVVSTAVNPKNGSCRTYDGTSTCIRETALLSLPSVQDPTVVDTQCDDSCGIGPCVSACEQSCDAQFPANTDREARKACKEACVCTCKLSRPAGCPQPNNCD